MAERRAQDGLVTLSCQRLKGYKYSYFFKQGESTESSMCEICDRIQMIKSGDNPFFVRELTTGYVVLSDNQHFKGYTLFLLKEHMTELFELEDNTRARFLEEMTIVAEAVSRAFGAEKMNYECF